MKGNKMELLGNAPMVQALLAMGVPTMLGMMVNAFYNLADAYFVGGLGTRQMGAISVVYPLGQTAVGLGLLFGNGAASYLSRLLGKGEKEKADQVASVALMGGLLSGGALILIFMIFLRPILTLLGATEGILPYAVGYGRIYVISCICSVFNVTMNNIATSEGAAKTTMFALMAGAALNVALDPVFIYGLDKGVAGAAIATAISQAVSTVIYLVFIFRGKSVYHFAVRNCVFTKEIVLEIGKIGVPTFVFQLLTSVSVSLVNAQAGPYGDSVIAAMGAVTRIVSMGSLMVFGFLKGFQPIAGYSYGAGKFERLQVAIRTALAWSTIFCAAYGLALAAFPHEILSQFSKGDVDMIRAGARALRINGLSFMGFGFCTVYSSLLLALGKGGEGFFLGACRQGICFVPVILTLPVIWGLPGILYAQPIADGVSVIITAVMAVHVHRRML